MPIMPTRVNRVPRLGQPAPVSTGDQPVPLASGEIDGHDKLSRIMRAMANGNLAEAKQWEDAQLTRSARRPRLPCGLTPGPP